MSLPVEHPVEWTEEKVERFWNFESQFPQRYFTFFSAGRIASYAKPFFSRNAKILDYGAGVGHLVERLLTQNRGKIAALDFSPKSVASVSSKFGQAPDFLGAFQMEDILASPLVGTFDFIFLIETIEHLDDTAFRHTLANIKRLLAPDGLAMITTPYREELMRSLVCCPDCMAVFHRWQHVRSWNEDGLRIALETEGFVIRRMEIKDFSTHPLLRILKRIRNFLTGRTAANLHEASKLIALVSPHKKSQ